MSISTIPGALPMRCLPWRTLFFCSALYLKNTLEETCTHGGEKILWSDLYEIPTCRWFVGEICSSVERCDGRCRFEIEQFLGAFSVIESTLTRVRVVLSPLVRPFSGPPNLKLFSDLALVTKIEPVTRININLLFCNLKN